MSDLLRLLMKRSDANARAEVSAYMRELPEYSKEAADPKAYADTLDYAVWFRRRTVERVSEDQPLVAGDLSFIGDIGQRRARRGFSLDTARRVLTLHANLMLREIYDAAEGQDVREVLHLMSWFGSQGTRGTDSYLTAYMDEQHLRLSVATRVRTLTQLLLAGDATAPSLARSLGVDLHEHYLVVIVRVPGQLFGRADTTTDTTHDELVASVFKSHLVPLCWQQPNELLALVPHDGSLSLSPLSLSPMASEGDRLLSLVREIVGRVGRPCAVGTAAGPVNALTKTAELARRVAHVAPVETTPRTVCGVADVFVELGAAQLPEVDHWLREIARRLANGPDLVLTLNAYYRADMNRLATAAALHIHPRTLDYRLQRVRDLAMVDPGSVRGVRILSTTVARVLAGAWT
ncbi:PucR family transcriptional regulator [Nonomuraea lactucae]|uniref:PucR family transcriptional regulator n=1 Tax=Nonomuraea lactucae TaxID=2249762 RepID=UPI000DE2B541|nr:helix-turn-helix domain-containing protein [Nonomuraea lactucae]